MGFDQLLVSEILCFLLLGEVGIGNKPWLKIGIGTTIGKIIFNTIDIGTAIEKIIFITIGIEVKIQVLIISALHGGLQYSYEIGS